MSPDPRDPGLEARHECRCFRTLTAADKLRDAGLDDAQARAIVDSIRDAQVTGLEHLATKADIARLEGRIDGLEGRIDGLESRIDGLEGRLSVLQWVVGIQSAVILAIALRVFGLV